MSKRDRIEQLLQADPDDVFLNYALAQAHVADGDLDAAIARFDRVLELDPAYVAAYFHRGQTLARDERIAEARETIVHGIEVARRVGDVHAAGEMTGFLESLPDVDA